MAGKLDSFFDNQQKVDELQQRRKEGMSEGEIKEKMEEMKDELKKKWGEIDFIDIDKLDMDVDGIPYIILRVDDNVVNWINDLQAMLNVPIQQVIFSSLTMYHSLMSYTLFMVTGDPLYQRRKQQLHDDQQKALDIIKNEVNAVKSRLVLIDDLQNDLIPKEEEDGQPVGSDTESKDEGETKSPSESGGWS